MNRITKFDSVADRTLAVIREKGVRVEITLADMRTDGAADVYNPTDDSWSAANASGDSARSVRIDSAGVTIAQAPFTLLVDAAPFVERSAELAKGVSVRWQKQQFVVLDAAVVMPAEQAMMYQLTLSPALS